MVTDTFSNVEWAIPFKKGDEVIFMQTYDDSKAQYLGKHGIVVRPGPSHTDVRFEDGKVLSLMNNHLKGYE